MFWQKISKALQEDYARPEVDGQVSGSDLESLQGIAIESFKLLLPKAKKRLQAFSKID